ncbi:MAG: DUF1150 family protein [Rhodoblastus sp.]
MTHSPFTPEQFAKLGAGQVAYVREMTADDIKRLFPQAPEVEAGLKLFALLSEEGAPIVLADSRDTAIASAWENQLQAVSLH